jgi:hypothetical protein
MIATYQLFHPTTSLQPRQDPTDIGTGLGSTLGLSDVGRLGMTAAAGPDRLARRARLQLICAIACAVLTIAAFAVPEWIEAVTTLEPDGGGGELEWLLAAAFGLASVVLGVLTFRTRRRLLASRAGASI